MLVQAASTLVANLLKARITNKDKKDSIRVMYNPQKYSDAFKADFNTPTEGDNKGVEQYLGTKREDFTVELFYDTTLLMTDVRTKIKELVKLVSPKIAEQQTKRLPTCIFSWGNFSFKGIITKIKQDFTYFSPLGTPVRANVTITFRSTSTHAELVEALGLEACRKLWQVKQGDRLDLIAHEVFRDHTRWKDIAEHNNIEDPLRFPYVEVKKKDAKTLEELELEERQSPLEKALQPPTGPEGYIGKILLIPDIYLEGSIHG